MKKFLISIIAAICAIGVQAQTKPIAVSDTVEFSGTAPVKFNIISNDIGTFTFTQFNLLCVKYGPSANTTTTPRTIAGMGKLLLKADGTGTFTPLATYQGGILEYTITNNCGQSHADVVFKVKKVAPIPDPNPDPIPSPDAKSYTLIVESVTSAGVVVDGVTVRNLWHNKKQNAGKYTPTWDGKDDAGNVVNMAPNVKARILVTANNMSYTWKADIGNSSRVAWGPNKLRALRTPHDGVQVGNYLYLCTGFVEGNSPTFKVALDDIGFMIPVQATTNGDIDFETIFCATDDINMYWAGFDSYRSAKDGTYSSGITSCVYATKVSNDGLYTFTSGTTTRPTLAQKNYSVIDLIRKDENAFISGIAVMKTGNYLYVSHKQKNTINVFNKTSGALVTTIQSALEDIVIEGNNLYGIMGTNVNKYNIELDGSLTQLSVSMQFTYPISLSIKNGVIIVVDEGSSQVKAFNENGTSLWTLGQQGGYKNSPMVANDKFDFHDFNNGASKKGFVVQQGDGSIWVGDAGNCRTMHFNTSRAFVESIDYLPMNYNVAVDPSTPNRVFATFLEFSASTRKLVANWSGNLTNNYIFNGRRWVFRNFLDKGGKTFATIHWYPSPPNDENRQEEWVELSSSGIRYTGIRFDAWTCDAVEANGDIIHYDGDFGVSSGTGYIKKKSFVALNSSGNPTWSAYTTIGSFPLGNKNPYFMCTSSPSSKGYIFSESWANTGYHLGRVIGDKYVWKNGKSTLRSYIGEFPTSDSFDCGNGVEYGGNNVYNIDSFVFWGYHGEFWKNNQTNKFKGFHQNGNMLIDIGLTGPQAQRLSGTNDAPREAAGNSFSGGLVKAGDGTYKLYVCDESRNGAICEFTITGANTVRTYYLTP